MTQANKKAAEASTAKDELEALPAVRGELKPIDAAFTGFMLELMNSRARYGVEITQAAPAKSGSSERNPVEQLADDLKGTKVKSLKVQLQGAYSDYERFSGFLEHIRQMGATSIVYLKVKDNTYSLSVRIYGKS